MPDKRLRGSGTNSDSALDASVGGIQQNELRVRSRQK